MSIQRNISILRFNRGLDAVHAFLADSLTRFDREREREKNSKRGREANPKKKYKSYVLIEDSMMHITYFKAFSPEKERKRWQRGEKKKRKITKRDSYVNPKKYINLTF